MTLLEAYATAQSLPLQVWPARPRSIYPPTGFVDRISERIEYPGVQLVQRSPTVEVVVIHGLFDSADAVAQGDAFVDGFLAYVATQYHAAGANTLVAVVATEDDPNYFSDWILPIEARRNYYATTISLEGFAES